MVAMRNTRRQIVDHVNRGRLPQSRDDVRARPSTERSTSVVDLSITDLVQRSSITPRHEASFRHATAPPSSTTTGRRFDDSDTNDPSYVPDDEESGSSSSQYSSDSDDSDSDDETHQSPMNSGGETGRNQDIDSAGLDELMKDVGEEEDSNLSASVGLRPGYSNLPREQSVDGPRRGATSNAATNASRRNHNNHSDGLRTLQRLQNESRTLDEDERADAPSMPNFSANRWEKQFGMMKQSIPPGADSHRIATQEQDLKNAVQETLGRKLKAENNMWRHTRMRHPLHSFQVTAVAWMLDREDGQVEPRGGLLADEMGLGKTIVTLACMVTNLPSKEDRKEPWRATLVVVPNQATAMQWKDEIDKHVNMRSSSGWHGAMVYNTKETIPIRVMKKMSVM